MKLFPENIQKIAFVALAGKPEKEKVEFGLKFLNSNGYEVVICKSVVEENSVPYLSSDIKTRVSDVHDCWRDKSIDLIFAVRGGYGSAQILPYIDWNVLKTRKVPFIGYSDMTAFHLAMCAKKTDTAISGPMIHNLQILAEDSFTLNSLQSVFHNTQILEPNRKKLLTITEGSAEGKIYPVTLSVLVSLIGTPFFPDLDGSILLLEDINEPVYKLDRYFTQLEHSGILSNISGLLLGTFSNCGKVTERFELFAKISKKLRIPVIANIPFGHTYPRISVKYESICIIKTSSRNPILIMNNTKGES